MNPPLADGFSPVPAGKIAAIVTCLEMRAKPPLKSDPPAAETLRLERLVNPDLTTYRDLFRAVGERWIWISRLIMADEKLLAILGHPSVEVHVLKDGERALGLLELDFREAGQCELAFFGLVVDAIGKGAGRFLMNRAIEKAWSRPIDRFWVHTCSFDSAEALPFYQRSGFAPYAMLVEIMDDPRFSGQLGRDAAPHVPLIAPRTT